MWPFKKRGPAPAGLVIDPAAGDPRARALIDALAARDRRTVAEIFGTATDPDTRAYLMEVASGGALPFWLGALLFYLVIIIYVWAGGVRAIFHAG